MNQKKMILKHTLSMGFATYVAQGVGVVTSVAMRAFLGPSSMGVWTILQIILGYCGYASFGTTKAMARDYPILRGRGKDDDAEHLKDLTTTFTMVMSLIPALCILIYTVWKWSELENAFRIGLLFMAAFLFLQRFYDLILTLLRSDKKFSLLSEVTVLNAIGMLAIVFVFVRFFNIYGLFLGSFVVTALCLGYILWRSPYQFSPYWNSRELIEQLKLAIPLLTISFLGTLYKSIDKILIAKFLGFGDVGLYSIAMMITSLILAFPMILSNVLYPHTLEGYGRTQSSDSISKHLTQPALILAVFVPILCGIAIFFTPLIVKLFLPKFEAGIPAMRIYMGGIFFILLAQFASNILTTLDKYWINIPILIASSVFNAVLNLVFLSRGFGLSGVAIGTTLSFFFYGTATFIAAAKNIEPLKQAVERTAHIAILNLSIFFCVFLIDALPVSKSFLVSSLLKSVGLLVVAVPFLIYLENKVSVLSQLYLMLRKRR